MTQLGYMYVPCEKERFVEVVEDIDDKIVVAGGVDVGSRELIVDEDDLLGNTSWGERAICDIPCEIEVRVFTPHRCTCGQ